MIHFSKLSQRFLSKHATDEQKEAIKELADADYDPKVDKLEKKYKPDTFVGNFDKFKETDLSEIFDEEELESLFNLLDADESGDISQKEIRALAKLGKTGSKNKIDNSDLKALFKTINNLAEKEDDDAEEDFDKDFDDLTGEIETTKKYNDDDELIAITKVDEDGNSVEIKYVNGRKVKTIKENADGSREVIKYDKKGRKKSSVYTDEDGTKTITIYKNGHKYKEKVVDEDGEILYKESYKQQHFWEWTSKNGVEDEFDDF